MTEIEKQNAEAKEVPSILEKKRILPADKVLRGIVVMFFIVSLVAVYTAISQLEFKSGGDGGFPKKHIYTLCFSALIMLFCYFFMGARFLRKMSWIAFAGSLLMTLAAYIFGDATNEAHRWLTIGPLRFQPSELLKIGTIMLLSARLSARHHIVKRLHLLPSTIDIRKWWRSQSERNIIRNEVLPIVAPIALACIVILPAHTSSALHLYLVAIVILFIAGIRWQEIAKLSTVAIIAGFILLVFAGRWGVVKERVTERIGGRKANTEQVHRSVLDKYSDSDRSCMAIQNGGLFGVGAGRSVMRARLTHPESDYLFAIVVEEFGLLLSFVIILLYLWLFFRALRIFEKCQWLYAGLLVVGLALLITSQGFLHIGVTIGFIPETGQNLPFITQGRTSMFCTSIALGIILSISRQVEQGTLVPPSQRSDNKHI